MALYWQYDVVFQEEFDADFDQLLPLISKGKQSVKATGRDCYNYQSRHQDEILSLSKHCLPFERLDTMGCIESNIGKTIALRMKTHDCSWSRAGAKAMSAIRYHLPQLEQHAFKYEEIELEKKDNPPATNTQKTEYNSTIHQATFPIVRIEKVATPFYQFFENIINPKELP